MARCVCGREPMVREEHSGGYHVQRVVCDCGRQTQASDDLLAIVADWNEQTELRTDAGHGCLGAVAGLGLIGDGWDVILGTSLFVLCCLAAVYLVAVWMGRPPRRHHHRDIGEVRRHR
jgi:hypothetical protein